MLLDTAVSYSLAASCSYLPSDRLRGGKSSYVQSLAPGLVYSAQLSVDELCASATVFEFADEDAVLVAFRGSTALPNYRSMFQLGLVRSQLTAGAGGGRVHCGYQEATLQLYERLRPFLDRRAPKRAVFVGHSYGGGTATMCALLYSADRGGGDTVGDMEVVTFAGPRVGDAAFAASFDSVLGGATTHLVHDKDPVLAQNQPLWDALGYVHTGRLQRCAADSPVLLREDARSGGIAWNFADHAQYLGTYMGPR